ncbi:MAG: hypothetical protein H6559_36430 [Lewinellaceae bacterium]|nr:hypothetical protein [Lewinellaceae bacterium]
MSKKEVAKRFVDAVNAYIEVQNEKMKRYGLTEFLPEVAYLENEQEDLLIRFSKHTFPDNTPHRHLYFFDEFKQNSEYIAFGGNANYNDVYVVEKKTGKVLVFSEEEKFLNYCADSFASFLEAFTVLINLEAALGRKKEIADPLAILNEAVAAAGGEEYQAFYKFIFPISIEKMLN